MHYLQTIKSAKMYSSFRDYLAEAGITVMHVLSLPSHFITCTNRFTDTLQTHPATEHTVGTLQIIEEINT